MYGDPVFGTVNEQFPFASTKHGKIVGETIDKIAVFRGIPYGGRCDRERRFMPACEPDPWDGVRDCTKNGPICVQTAGSVSDFYGTGGHPEKLGLEYETQDENCLCLNVLTPGLDKKKRPVMFYIHGGGYWQLSGSILLGADKLTREQDVVLVSVNHRLHVFGYLYLGELDTRYKDSGNVGHLDLILALKWVRDNIEAFGGDPECVTIIGESGGSDKVHTLMHMQQAKGLFHRAIATSCFLPIGRITKDLATEYTLEVLNLLGVEPNNLEKLQQLPARYITQKVFEERTRLWCLTFAPVLDGIHINQPIGDGYVPSFDTSIPIIMGASEDEMASFDVESSFDITECNLREKLLERGINYGLDITESNVDSVIEAFRKTNHKYDTADQLFMKIVSIKSFMGGAQYMAEDYVKNGTNPVFLYLNRYDAPHGTYPERRYAGHCTDVSPAFRMVAYPQMEEYSKKIAAAYCAFMRTGNPSTDTLSWPVFGMEKKETMIYDCNFSVVSDPLKEELDALDKVSGNAGVVDCFMENNYKFPLKGKCFL